MDGHGEDQEQATEKQYFYPPLWRQRRTFVNELLCSDPTIKTVADMGCGEGALVEILMNNTQFRAIYGVDIDSKSLFMAKDRCSPNEQDFKYLRELPISLTLLQG
jgi:methylase of polypeptide subunit release factors